MTRRFKQVDVFADTVGDGNPLAVVLDGSGLDDAALAKFAAWTNLSETTFVLPPTEPDADYHVRIFTPTAELPFAGHPTIGTCHAWLEAGGHPQDSGRVVQQCGAGLVTLKHIDGRLAFETPPLIRSGAVDGPTLATARDTLGIETGDVRDAAWIDNGPGWIGLLLHDVDVLRSLNPTMVDDEHKIGVAALIPAVAAGDPTLEVRAFFHAGGTREDPVTGSLNGSLAQWLLGNGTLTAPYIASQGTAMGRNGRVHVCTDDTGGIWVGGDAITGIDGSLTYGSPSHESAT